MILVFSLGWTISFDIMADSRNEKSVQQEAAEVSHRLSEAQKALEKAVKDIQRKYALPDEALSPMLHKEMRKRFVTAFRKGSGAPVDDHFFIHFLEKETVIKGKNGEEMRVRDADVPALLVLGGNGIAKITGVKPDDQLKLVLIDKDKVYVVEWADVYGHFYKR